MTTFVDILPKIQAMAHNLCKKWGDKFQTDELVNEAWMRGRKTGFTDAPLIMRRAKFDIQDYIRHVIGREVFMVNGEKRERVHKIPRMITNIDSYKDSADDHTGHGTGLLDGEYVDHGLERLENDEIITKLVLSEPDEKKIEVVRLYYLEEMMLKEIGEKLGHGEPHICNTLKKGLSICREKAKRMELIEV